MIERTMGSTLRRHLEWFPVVHLSGPRQSGKTTLAQMVFPDAPYANLESPSTLALCREDPNGFLDGMLNKGRPAVVDEAQRYPELFSWIQVLSDRRQENGLFVLTGSQNFLLNDRVSQSLAGRTSVLTLLPLSIPELPSPLESSLEERLLTGGYPRLYDERRPSPPPAELYESYVATYLERDVRQLSAVQDLATFHRFLQLCAARVGGLLNKANLSVEAGISQATVERWLSVLEASHVIFRLQPYFQNLSKRLVKTPKLYFCDAGLVCHLVGIRRPQELELHPLRGALFENLVFSEFLKRSFNSGTRPSILFFRDKTGHEVDFLIADGDRLRAFEVKSSATFRRDYVSDLRYVRDLIGPRVAEAHLLYAGAEDASVNGIRVRNGIRYFMAEA